MTCPYCTEKDGTKKNTHYLSDNIIRTALNNDGSTKREKGFYFDMSNNSGSIKFNFQRATPQKALEEGLGRQPTEDEIEDAKDVPFSVDDVFCPGCEAKFTIIEDAFTDNILPKLRDADLSNVTELSIDEISIIRKYLYLQLWRSSICHDTFQLPEDIQNDIRELLLNANIENKDLCKYPISLTYLNTEGGQEKYTQNIVGFTDDENLFVIFMNDFIIQFFTSENEVNHFDFHQLNNIADYEKYINITEDSFLIKVFSDKDRIKFNLDLMKESKSEPLISMLTDNFSRMYFAIFKTNPTEQQIRDYLSSIIGADQELTLKFSNEELRDKTVDYIKSLLAS